MSLLYILITYWNCSFTSLAHIVIESGFAYVFTDLKESLYLEKLAFCRLLAFCCLGTVIIEPNYLEEKIEDIFELTKIKPYNGIF